MVGFSFLVAIRTIRLLFIRCVSRGRKSGRAAIIDRHIVCRPCAIAIVRPFHTVDPNSKIRALNRPGQIHCRLP